MPTLDRIVVYPVKSLDGVDLAEARVLPGGALEHDRRWRLVDAEGRVVNAKRTPRFHAIRAEFDLADRLVSLSRWTDPPTVAADTFPLVPGRDGPAPRPCAARGRWTATGGARPPAPPDRCG